jgi:hypothetical protein
MSDTLGAIRRALRSSQAAERRKLRHKMSRYDSLATKGKTPDNLYDVNSAKTTQDVIEETLSLACNKDKRRRALLSHDSTDRLLRECNIVSPEVRDAWHARIGMSSLLTDDIRAKLSHTTNSYLNTDTPEAIRMRELCEIRAREQTLATLAKWMVYMWCEGEGYDPGKHPRK